MKLEQWLGKDNKLGMDIWTKKYQQDGETFDAWLYRVSGGDDEVGQLIIDKKFLFGGRILSNRGMYKKGRKVTYSNCYVISPPEDNIESIFTTASRLARTFSYGGGCGIDISNLSPRGAKINNTAKETTGAVSFMELYNMITGLIGQNGRRGALMLSLDCDHPDLEEFISVKNDLNSITKANISVKVTSEFMEAAINDKDYELTFVREETGEEIRKTVKARKIFEQLCKNNWDFGEPGILFWDEIKRHNLLANDPQFEYAGVNPCAEEPLPAGGSCLLGSINLAEFVIYPENGDYPQFDFEGFKYAVRVAVKALNDVLDEGLELHPLLEQRISVTNWRQIGLGIFGLADMLIKMGFKYGDGNATYISDVIGFEMINEAIKASAKLAKTRKPYPKFKPEALSQNLFYIYNTDEETKALVEQYGLHNSQLLTIAPTGSLSTMLGVSGGIEPIFATHYTRKTESLHGEDKFYTVYTPIVERFMEENNIVDVNDLPPYFVTARDIKPLDRIKMQSVWQQHIDASISSTVNLPEEATVEDVMKLYEHAWRHNLKGLTVFRENCARTGVLTTDKDKKEDVSEVTEPVKSDEKVCEFKLDSISPISRHDLGYRLSGTSYAKQTACGKLYITINRDADNNLVEVFIDPGKSGGCSANAECIGRMASSMMRSGMKVLDIVDSTKGVKCAACTNAKGAKKKIDGMSCGDVIAKAIEEEYKYWHLQTPPQIIENTKPIEKIEIKELKRLNVCPECWNELANEGGCVVCKNCGYSKCD